MQGAHMGVEGCMWRSEKWPKQLHKYEDLCKRCAAVELKKNTKLAKTRAKATGEGGKQNKNKIVKQEPKKGRKSKKPRNKWLYINDK